MTNLGSTLAPVALPRIKGVNVRRVSVRDFQSIKEVSVDFGDFTVLVGPSSSGKSAFLRAVRACLRNTFVPSNVRQGATRSVIGVEFSDAPSVEIMRGKSLSSYLIGSGAEAFTKSGRTVPAEVAAAIRLPLISGVDANFAFQFDKPFLLSEPGSQAAQVVGSLTNVSLLHTAVREANRRRQEAAGLLKTRQADIARYRVNLQQFAALKARRGALEKAEALLAEAREAEARVAALRRIAFAVVQAQADLDSRVAEEPPDVLGALVGVESLNRQLAGVTALTGKARTIARRLQELVEQAKSARAEARRLETERTQLLQDLGTCPTCGAVVVVKAQLREHTAEEHL